MIVFLIVSIVLVLILSWMGFRLYKISKGADSLNEKTAKLRRFRKFYSALSRVDRDSIRGKLILKSIRYQERKIKELIDTYA